MDTFIRTRSFGHVLKTLIDRIQDKKEFTEEQISWRSYNVALPHLIPLGEVAYQGISISFL